MSFEPFEILEYQCKKQDERCAIIDNFGSYCYSELLTHVTQAVNGFASLGLSSSDRLAVVSKNRYEMMVLVLAAMAGGPIVVPVNRRLNKSEIEWIVDDCKPKAIVIDAEISAWVEGKEIRTFVLENFCDTAQASSQCETFVSWLCKQSFDEPSVSRSPSRPYLMVYTSGTSGNPKGVVLTEENCVSQLMATTISIESEILPGETMLQALPLFHVGGIFVSLMVLSKGATLQLRRDFDPQYTLDILLSRGVEHATLVPAMIKACIGIKQFSSECFPSLKSITYGASPISPDVLIQAMRFFACDFVQVYGMTETHSVISVLGVDDHRQIADLNDRELAKSAGRAVMGTDIRICSDQGEELPVGQPGEICVKSGHVMQGYWQLPESTAGTFRDGYLRTGDVGRISESGHLYIVDRMKDIIVSGGENISSLEVEAVLLQHPSVDDVAVIGIPDERWGESVLALVVSDKDVNFDDVYKFIRSKISGFKVPKNIMLIEEIPRNPGGKVLKAALRQKFSAVNIACAG